MHIEILTIFPGYFALAAAGEPARQGDRGGLLEVTVTDMREFAATGTARSTTSRTAAGPGWS